MVDAAIGGKNGINFLDFKNQIGLYQEPKAIVVEPDFLLSLSRETYQKRIR
jgi:3-dehydroquinate synthase